jgi:hypothetical protein
MGCGTYKPVEIKATERKSNSGKNMTKGNSVSKVNKILHLQDWFSQCLLSALLIQNRTAGKGK